MSRVIAPLAIVSGLNNLVGPGPSSDLSLVRSVIIANISPYALYVTGVDTERWLSPMEVDRYVCADGLSFLNGSATQIFTNASFPANACLVTLLYEGDPDPGGTYPFSLGSGSVSLTQPTQVINDGFPITTTVVEATPAGQVQSFIQILNDGTINFYVLSGGVRKLMFSITPGSGGGAGTAVGVFHGTSDLANTAQLLVDNIANAQSEAAIVQAGGSIGFLISPLPIAQIPITYPYMSGAGVNATAMQANTDGSVTFPNGAIKFFHGSTPLSGFQIVSGTGSGAFNHSLGVVPLAVFFVPTQQDDPWFVGAYTSTQFTVSGVTAGKQWKALVLA